MTLLEAFNRELMNAISAHAVWLPGKPVQLGDVLVKRNGEFHKAGHISNFGATAEVLPHSDIGLDLKTSKVTQKLFQLGVELPDTAALDLAADASVRISLNGKSQFILKTPTLTGSSIQNMLTIAATVAGLANWKHDKFYIVEELYSAVDWSFLGSKENASSFELKGKGAAILSFLAAGASFGLTSSGNVDLKLLGKGGALAMNTVRVRKDGSLNHGE
jgi:hypothetical protein